MKSDPAHVATDAEIAKIEKLITKEYKKAHKEVSKKLDDYLARFAAKDEKWQEWVANGTKTKKEYTQWRKGQILVGKRWQEMRDALAQDYTNAAKITMSITKDFAPEVYAINHNYATFQVEKGALIDTSYSLYSRESVEYMYKGKPKLYHTYGKAVAKQIKEGKQYAWDRRRITSVLTQAILQGESIPAITKRLEQVTVGDHKAAIRNARTMMTGVQNAGRVDAFDRARSKGIPVRKQWLATLDSRTRHWHRELDGVIVDNDKPFENEFGKIMFPGDPEAHPANVYNCFVGNTKIATDSNIVRSYKHDYSGRLFTVKTASGVEFTCTPNHPILTASGWIAAERLKYGDNLLIASVRKDDSLRINPHVNHTFARIDALHSLFKIMGGKRTTSLSVNFHGDIPASDVEIITQKWFLGSDWNTSGSNSVDKFLLKHANKTFMGKSAFVKHFGRIGFAALSFVSSLSKALAFVFRGMRHTVVHSFRTIAGGDAIVLESKTDNMSRDSKLICKGLNGSSSIVFADDIVDVKVFSVSHVPVYNLQTDNGHYFVNSSISESGEKCSNNFAIAHNCRCTLMAAIKGFEIDTSNTDLRHDEHLGGLTYEEWLAEKKSTSNPIDLPEQKAANIKGAWFGKYGGGAAKQNKYTAAEGQQIIDQYDAAEAAKAQAKIDKLGAKEYSDIWQGQTVKVSDYANMQTKIKSKHYTLDHSIKDATAKGDTKALAKYQAQQKSLEKFEKDGKKYLAETGQEITKPAKKAAKAPKAQSVAKPTKAAQTANTGPVQASVPKTTKKVTEKEAAKAVKDAQDKVDALTQKQYVNIWKDPVTTKDYPDKKGAIGAKKKYFEDELDKAKANGWASKEQKFTQLLDDLADFEKQGKLYETAKDELDAAKKVLKSFEDAKKAKVKAKVDAAKKEFKDLGEKKYDLSFANIDKGKTVADLTDADIKKMKAFKNAYGAPVSKNEIDTVNAAFEDLKKRRRLQRKIDTLEGNVSAANDAYSAERKAKAVWARTASEYREVDKYYEITAKKVHGAKSAFEHEGYYHYTWGSGPFNQPLAGFRGSWSPSAFVGPGKLDINTGGYGSKIRGLTQLCSKSKYDRDFWVQSGQSQATLEGFLKIPYGSLRNMSDAELQKYVGVAQELPQFISGAVNKGGGSYTPGDMLFNIYCPKGSEALYVRSDGHFKKNEHEMILQRGGTYRISRIYWGRDEVHGGRKLIVDLELRLEKGYNKFQQ